MIYELESFNVKSINRISAFLGFMNIESNYLAFVTEDVNWFNYYNDNQLSPTVDTSKYKGRGLLKIKGYNQYLQVGQNLNANFLDFPDNVASENSVHLSASESEEQLYNCIKVSLWYYWNVLAKNISNPHEEEGINKIDILSKIDKKVYVNEVLRIKNYLTELQSSGAANFES